MGIEEMKEEQEEIKQEIESHNPLEEVIKKEVIVIDEEGGEVYDGPGSETSSVIQLWMKICREALDRSPEVMTITRSWMKI